MVVEKDFSLLYARIMNSMLLLLLLKGSFIGLSVAVPLGPTGLLCLRYSLVRGKSFGVASGMGIALADALCGALAAIGLTVFTEFIQSNHAWLHLIGSVFIFLFGIIALLGKKPDTFQEVVRNNHFGVFFLTFFLTLSNPLTILSLTGIYTVIGLDTLEVDLIATGLLSIGIFLGSATWWLILSSGSSYFGQRISRSTVHRINQVLGVLLIVLSIFTFGIAINLLLS